MITILEYFICKETDLLYKIIKMEDGQPTAEYKVEKKDKWRCNCISGHIRGYCKHKDWISLIHGALPLSLPEYVHFQKESTNKAFKEFVRGTKKEQERRKR